MSTKTQSQPIKEEKRALVEEKQPVTMPGYDKHHKTCDIEVVENTLKIFVEADTPTKKGTHLALLAFLATQIKTEPTSLPMIFSILNKKLEIAINAKAGDRFRTILYYDYYPQTRSPKEFEIKGIKVKKYQWDNHTYCTVPLVLEPEHQPKTLWGFRFKEEFVEASSKVKITKARLLECSEQL